MKKFKFASAIVALLLGALMLAGSIPLLMGKENAIYEIFFFYGVGIAAVVMLAIGIVQAIKKDLPVSAKLHIAAGIVGILFQLISKFIGGYFTLIISGAYSLMLLVMELKEMKNQNGFAEKGLAIMIAAFAVVYANAYLGLIMLSKLLPNNIENIVYFIALSILPALLVAKGVVDIVRSFKPAKQAVVVEEVEETTEEKVEETTEEKVEE